MRRRLTLVCWLAFLVPASLVPASAQVPIASEGFAVFNQMFDSQSPGGPMKCTARLRGPAFDFAFRFNVGYAFFCNLSDFLDQTADLHVYTRVTPQGGEPVLLEETYTPPRQPEEMRPGVKIQKLRRSEFWFGGAFSVGEGDYRVEVLLSDGQNRRNLSRWDVHVARKKSERAITPAIPAGTVLPTVVLPWDGKLAARGLRLTLLLDAATMDPNEGKLYTWDRALLLQSLASLLRQTPCRSVRLVAFNLDQQREILRKEHFDRNAFGELSQALQQLELGTVSYRALQKHTSTELLAALARQETTAKQPADAVIFLGPSAHIEEKMPKEVASVLGTNSPRFFYFEYFPWFGVRPEFPDAIDYLTRELHGTVYKIHSAGDLGQAIQKMLAQLGPGETDKTPEPAFGLPPVVGEPLR